MSGPIEWVEVEGLLIAAGARVIEGRRSRVWLERNGEVETFHRPRREKEAKRYLELPMWHGYRTRRLTATRRTGIVVTSRALRYRVERVRLPDVSVHEIPVGREMGIDLRLGLDIVRMAPDTEIDGAIAFSQDQDLAEVAREVRDIARSADRWLKVVSAFPYGANASVKRGIDRTDWFRMDRGFYDVCLDPRDCRPRR